jgi:CHAT domain-containing protein/tetratricopeptide (TPR) repeat protein
MLRAQRIILLATLCCLCKAQTDRDAAARVAAELTETGKNLSSPLPGAAPGTARSADDLHKAGQSFEQAAQSWRAAGDTQKQIEALFSAAWTHYPLREFSPMLALLNQAMDLARGDEFRSARADLLASFGAVSNEQGEYRKALDQYAEALAIEKTLQNAPAVAAVTGYEANSWFLLAMAAEKANDNAGAIDAHRQAATLFQQAGFSKQAGLEYIRLANLSRQIGTPAALDQTAVFLNAALPLFEAVSDRPDLAMTWWTLGTVADAQNDFERARDAYLKVIPMLSDLPSAQSQAIALNSLALALDHLKDYSQAIGYYERALPRFAAAKDEPNGFLAGMKLGMAREKLDQTTQALAAYQAVIEIAKTAGDESGEAEAWSRLGLVHFNLRDWQPAMDALRAAQQLHANVKDKRGEAADWALIGSVDENRNQYREKLDASLRWLALLEGGGDPHDETQALISIGDAYNALHMSRQAIEYLERALAHVDSEAESDDNQKALILVELGEVYYGQTRLDKALDFENQSLDIARKLDNPGFLNRVRNDVGLTLQAQGEMKKARDIFEQILKDAEARNDKQQTYTYLNNLAKLHQDLGDNRESVNLFEQSLTLAGQDSSGSEGATLDGLGIAYHTLGQDEKAIATLNQALDLARRQGDQESEAISLNDLSLVYADMGRAQQALDLMRQALEKRRALEDEAGVGDLQRALGGIYQDLGDYDGAASYFAQALETQNKFGDEHGEALTHNSLGALQMNRKEPEAALREFNQALPLIEKFGDRRGEAILLSNIANALLDTGDLAGAAATFNRSLELSHQMRYQDGEALAQHGLGSVYERSGEYDRALASYRQALAVWRSMHAAAAESKAHSLIAKIERKQGKLPEAMAEIDESIRLLESQRGALGSEDLRAYFLSSISDPWKVRIDLLMDMNRAHPGKGWDARAFEATEGARARSLLDLLGQSRIDLEKGVDPALAAKDRAAERALSAKAVELRKIPADSADFRQLQIEVADLTAEHERIEAGMRAANPRYAALTTPRPLTLRQIQKQVLEPHTLLLEYSLGEERSYLFAVTPESLSVYELPKGAEIESAARDLNSDLQHHETDLAQLHKDEAALSAMLLTPVASVLKDNRLLIVADGELEEVPFGVLPSPSTGQPLVVTNEIVTQPSASAVAVLRTETAGRKKAPRAIAVIADPVFEASDPRLRAIPASPHSDESAAVLSAAIRTTRGGAGLERLDHSGEELAGIMQLANGLALAGFDANKTNVLDGRLANYRIVHFATHGLIDRTHPRLSGLALSLHNAKGQPIDGFLDMSAIFDMKLNADLVVLSACESGSGKLLGGEGLMGLTRGFFYAGAASLVVSLWSVDDEATSDLMRRFYRSMLGPSHLRPAAALREAQRSMLLDSKWQDPYYWAAFTIQGDWRRQVD